jgi:Ca-activated chloride channel homolog
VSGGMELDVIYNKEIRGKMESTTLSGGRRQVWEDRYQWILALAIFAFIVEIFLSSKKKIAMLILPFMMFGVSAYAGNINDGSKAYEKGDYEKSLKYFIDAQLENPDKPEMYYNIGNAYYKTGKYEDAANNFRQAAKSDNKQLKQKALYNLGNSFYRRGNHEEALKNYEEALKIDSNDSQSRENLEFVKKVIEKKKEEEKKKQEDQNKVDDKDGKEKDSEKKEQDDKGDKKEESEQGKNKTGDKKDDKNEDKKEESGTSDKSSEKKEESAQNQEKSGDKKAEAHEPKQDKSSENEKEAVQGNPSDKKPDNSGAQAERALNRLNDQPGRAMIPVYQKKRTEKDW